MISFNRLLLSAALVLGLAAVSAPASARDVDIGKFSATAVKSFCNDTPGASYQADGTIYGCGWDPGNGQHYLLCNKDGCFYSTPAARQSYNGRDALADIKGGKLEGNSPASGKLELPWLWIVIAIALGLIGFAAGRSTKSERRAPIGV